jgi:glyoxylase I family protein
VPSITGQVGVILTVRDVDRSAAWYAALLGMAVRYSHVAADGATHYVCLDHPAAALDLCLVSHAAGSADAFSEYRAGLDHLEFQVASHEELVAWAERLDELGVAHSGVRELTYTRNSMVTFRDPDNIQLEFFWRAPASNPE